MLTINITNNGPNRVHVRAVSGALSSGDNAPRNKSLKGRMGLADEDAHTDLELEDDAKPVSETGNFILGVGNGKTVRSPDGHVVIEEVAADVTFARNVTTVAQPATQNAPHARAQTR